MPSRQHWLTKANDVAFITFKKILEKRDAVLHLVVFGSDVEKSKKRIKDLGIGKNVIWHPFTLKAKEMAKWYNSADVVWDDFSTLKEGRERTRGFSPLCQLTKVSLKAMACNAPLISKPVPRSLYGKDIPIVEAKSIDDMVDKVMNVKKYRKTFDRQRNWVSTMHSEDAVRMQFAKLLEKIELIDVLIIGNGVTGKAMKRLYKGTKYKAYVRDRKPISWDKTPKVMHICIPYSKAFIGDVIAYIRHYEPMLTIINSTVPVGTTDRIVAKVRFKVVHSPIRGQHDNMVNGLKAIPKIIGGKPGWAEMASQHFEELGLKTVIYDSAKESELAKMLDTTQYGLSIAFAQEINRMCRKFNANFDNVYTATNKTYNEGHEKLGMRNVLKPVMFPGIIGGTCVMPNLKLLKMSWKSKFFDAIGQSNEKRKKELK